MNWLNSLTDHLHSPASFSFRLLDSCRFDFFHFFRSFRQNVRSCPVDVLLPQLFGFVMKAAHFDALRTPAVSVDMLDGSGSDINDARRLRAVRQRNDEEERLAIRASTKTTRIVTRLRRPTDFAGFFIDEGSFGRRCNNMLGCLSGEIKGGQFHLLHKQIIAPRIRLGRFIGTTTACHAQQQG